MAALLLPVTTAHGHATPPRADEEPAPEIVTRPPPAVLVSVGELLKSTANTNEPSGSDDWTDPDSWTRPEGLDGSLKVMLALTVLSLAPAILLMTTCYVRIVIVLGLLRQAIGLQSLPPAQVTTSLALFMTLFVMAPVWTRVHQAAIEPYIDPAIDMSWEDAVEAGVVPIREFMSHQIDIAGNHDDVHLFFGYLRPEGPSPETFEEVPLRVLLPAFLISELKTAFLMGFQIYLPFLIVDLVVASVTISMGMLMLPPAVISLPLKLLLFVLVDGWRLVVQMLMDSFGTIG
ncbi:MAG: flagellar biosynthetic protein FliP [Planctomycetaceae bacterium]|nr:MAG: flagellar biosynthetic protein FliP [Planctomycetaceae bacterium]